MTTLHAKHSPSSLGYKEICPGWENAGGSNAAADEGTLMHEAAETGNLSQLSPEQQHQVAECLEYLRDLEAAADEVFKERRMDVAGITFGTADRVIHNRKARIIHIVDFKFGRQPVADAHDNLQGWCYAVAAFYEFDVDHVMVHFVIPRLDTVTRHSFSREHDYDRMVTRIATVIARAEESGHELNPDPKVCQYCANKGRCPALAAKALMIPKGNRWDLPANLDPGAITAPDQMARVLEVVPAIEAWASAIKQSALEMVRNGQEIPGYALRSRSGRRVIKDLLPAWAIINQEFGVTLEEFLPACSVKITDVEAAVKSRAPRGKGAETLRKLNVKFAEEGIVTTTPEVEYLAKQKE